MDIPSQTPGSNRMKMTPESRASERAREDPFRRPVGLVHAHFEERAEWGKWKGGPFPFFLAAFEEQLGWEKKGFSKLLHQAARKKRRSTEKTHFLPPGEVLPLPTPATAVGGPPTLLPKRKIFLQRRQAQDFPYFPRQAPPFSKRGFGKKREGRKLFFSDEARRKKTFLGGPFGWKWGVKKKFSPQISKHAHTTVDIHYPQPLPLFGVPTRTECEFFFPTTIRPYPSSFPSSEREKKSSGGRLTCLDSFFFREVCTLLHTHQKKLYFVVVLRYVSAHILPTS